MISKSEREGFELTGWERITRKQIWKFIKKIVDSYKIRNKLIRHHIAKIKIYKSIENDVLEKKSHKVYDSIKSEIQSISKLQKDEQKIEYLQLMYKFEMFLDITDNMGHKYNIAIDRIEDFIQWVKNKILPQQSTKQIKNLRQLETFIININSNENWF